jgi:SAM-dependent methyltransferase
VYRLPGSSKLSLSSGEIDRVPSAAWGAFLRCREAEFIFQALGGRRFRHGLELGAGNCVQSAVIARYCDKLICTELDPRRMKPRDLPNVQYRICDAEDLSAFGTGSFDLVFSSNMLEHLEHPERCLAECRRVLTREGLIVMTLPNRTWKFFSFVLSPLMAHLPHIHGASRSHLLEFVRFGPKRWARMMRNAGFQLLATFRLPFYHGYGKRCVPLLKLGNRIGLSSSVAFVLQPACAHDKQEA